jgi:putative oxidoreductase
MDKENSILQKILSPILLIVRLYWGSQFFMLGLFKLIDLSVTQENFKTMGVPSPSITGPFVGLVEGLGGLLLFLGLGSRFAAIPLAGAMLGAFYYNHSTETFYTAKPFLFLVASLLILILGAGNYSVDGFLKSRKGIQESPENPDLESQQ